LYNLEKSFVFIQGTLGNKPQQITFVVERDPRSIASFLIDINSPNVFAPKNNRKVRWGKGTTKLTMRQRIFAEIDQYSRFVKCKRSTVSKISLLFPTTQLGSTGGPKSPLHNGKYDFFQLFQKVLRFIWHNYISL